MNILVVHNYYKLHGGEDTVFHNEVELLKENGNNVLTYTRNNNEIDNFSVLKKIILPFIFLFNFKTYFDIKKIIKNNDIEIVHVHNTNNIISKAVYYAAVSCNVPIVQTIHNFRFVCPNGLLYRDGHICEECLNKGFKCAIKHKCYRNSRFQTILMSFNIRRLIKSKIFNKITFICLTEFNKNKILSSMYLNTNIVISDHIFIKPNFVENIVNNIIPFENREKKAIYASRLEESKGIKYLLESWKSIKEISLYIYGEGPLNDWCKTYIKNNDLKNVHLNNRISRDSLLKELSGSLFLVFPSLLYEGFPLLLPESFSVGTPVISTDIGNHGDIVINGINGFKYRNTSELLNAIDRLENDKLINAKTYEFYNSNFSKATNYEILMNIYLKDNY